MKIQKAVAVVVIVSTVLAVSSADAASVSGAEVTSMWDLFCDWFASLFDNGLVSTDAESNGTGN